MGFGVSLSLSSSSLLSRNRIGRLSIRVVRVDICGCEELPTYESIRGLVVACASTSSQESLEVGLCALEYLPEAYCSPCFLNWLVTLFPLSSFFEYRFCSRIVLEDFRIRLLSNSCKRVSRLPVVFTRIEENSLNIQL